MLGRADRSGPVGAAVLAALTVYLSFNAGGFFPGSVGYCTVAMAVLVVLAIMLVHEPFVRSTPALIAAMVLLAAFAGLTLVSGSWSDSWSRAMIEFDRALLYVLVLVFFGLLRHTEDGLEWGIRGFVAATFVVVAIGWITRVAPDVWPIALDLQPRRLSYPLTYWNALGLMCALQLVALLHLACGERQNRVLRVLGAAAVPLVASALLLTFSRSSLALAAVGVFLYLVVARPRRALLTVPVLAVATAVAVLVSLHADTVSSARYMSPAGESQGHHVLLIVLVCVAAVAVVRAALLPLDGRLDAWRAPRVDGRLVLAGVAVLVVLAAVVGLAAGGGGQISRRWDSFVHENNVGHGEGSTSERLTSFGNNGRIPQWRAAIDAFDEAPLLGKGAGTYSLQWDQHRPYAFTVLDAHSLYVEQMGELGLIGAGLLVAFLLVVLVGAARRLSGPQRNAYAAFLAMAAIWCVHAGIDWDWEMPAVTLWLFALGGLVLGRPRRESVEGRSFVPGRIPRLVGALCVGVLAITPVLVVISQSHLEKALTQFDANECPPAIGSSLASLHALGVRPEPYEIIGYCDLRYGQYELAERAMENAVARDPENWEMHYGLALSQAIAEKDPMPQLRRTRRLNPLEPLVVEEFARFRKAKGPEQRKRLAEQASLPL